MMVAEEDVAATAVAGEKGDCPKQPSIGRIATAAAAANSAVARYAADQRALLFSSRLGKGAKAKRQGEAEVQRLAAQELHRAEEQRFMEERNNELIDSLHGKVQELKEVVHETQTEVTRSTKLVELLHEGADNVLGKLQWANGRVREIAKQPAWRYTFLMTVFCILLLLFLYALGASGAMGRGAAAVAKSPSSSGADATKATGGFLSSFTSTGVSKKL